MSFIRAALVCLLACALLSQLPLGATAQTADETTLRNLVTQYFEAYARRDAEAVKTMWSERSPDAAPSLKYLQKVFATAGTIELASLSVVNVDVRGDRAAARVALQMNVTQAQTGKPAPGFGKMNRSVSFIKEEGAWKIWRETSYEEEVSARLAAASTEAEREQILAHETGLSIAELARTLNWEGMRIADQGDFERGLQIFQLALKFIEQADFKPGIIRVLNNLGDTRRRLGDYPEAQSYLQRALALAREIDDKESIGNAYANLGILYFLWGNYAASLEAYNQSIQIGEAIGNKTIVSHSLNNIADIYLAQGNYQLALDYLKRSLPLKEELKDKISLARTLGNIGVVYSRQGDYAQALEYFKRSIALKEEAGARADTSPTYNSLGLMRLEQGSYIEALENFNRALSMSEAAGDKSTVVESLTAIAEVERRQGHYQQSLATAERAARLAKEMQAPESLWELMTIAGQNYRALNQSEKARASFEEAIAAIEALRSQVAGGEAETQRFFETKVSPYQEMIRLLVAEDRSAEALRYAERAKARVLLDVLRSGRVQITKAMRPEEQAEERRLAGEMASLNAQVMREEMRAQADAARLADLQARLQKARLAREAFETNLYAAHPDLKSKRGEARPLTLEEARDLLPDARTALLEFALTDREAYLFVLTRNGQAVELKAYTLNGQAKELAESAESFRQSLGARNLDFRAGARALYDTLLAPAQKQLEGKTTLVIVPDAALWNLPFQALRSPKEKYLIEECAISYAPSLTVLREMMRKRSAGAQGNSLLAFGNPSVGRETSARVKYTLLDKGLPQLPEAEKQVRSLAELYGATASRVYTGAAASEDRAKAEAGRFRVLQFATHAVLNDTNPMYSYVVLSQPEGNREDGLLEAWEMMNLDLNADLVVLSACETARGRIGAGEGVIGMTWALFVAGSPTTVVSQWKVESASTTELMLEFHRALRAQNVKTSKAQAMQAASLKLLKSEEYKHPFYWAGFVVMGDAR